MTRKQIRWVCLACVLGIFVSLPAHATAIPSDDVVLVLYAKDVMVGFGDGYMGWDETLTRAQAVKIIVTAMGSWDQVGQIAALFPVFPDVDKDHWAFRFVNLACEFGIVKGFPDGEFKPEKQVTRAEYLVMLSRTYSALGGQVAEESRLVLEPKWMADEVLKVPDLVTVLGPGVNESFDMDMLRSEAGTLTYGLMEKFGLIYDLIGTAIDVKQTAVVLRLTGSEQTITIPLSSDAKCVKGQKEVGVSDVLGTQVQVILDKSKTCVLLHIE